MITVRGASDDLIEVDGDLSEEFTYRSDGDLIAFSDGTILRIVHSNTGVWRIAPVVRGASRLTIEQAAEGDEDNYSDRATLDGAVWVVHGIDYAADVVAERLLAEVHRLRSAGDEGYVRGLRIAANWLADFAKVAVPGLDQQTCQRLWDGAQAMAASAAERLGVTEEGR